jgi:hypothetical protein
MFSFIKSLFCKPKLEIVPGPSAEDIFNERLKSYQTKYSSLFDITKYTFGPNSATHESGDEFKFVIAPYLVWTVECPEHIVVTLSCDELYVLEKLLIDNWKTVRCERQTEQKRKNKQTFIEKYGESKC